MPGKPRPAVVPEASSETPVRVLAAATSLFVTKGARATTIRQIADAAGVNSQLIYYYFGDKAGLARAVLAEASARVNGLLVEAAQGSGTPRDRLERFIVAWVEVTLDHAPTIRMLHRMAEESGGALVPAVKQRASGNARLILQLIGEGIAAGQFRRDLDPRLAAASLVGMTHYLALGGPVLLAAMRLERTPRLERKLAEHTAELFLRGIDAAPRAESGKGRSRGRR